MKLPIFTLNSVEMDATIKNYEMMRIKLPLRSPQTKSVPFHVDNAVGLRIALKEKKKKINYDASWLWICCESMSMLNMDSTNDYFVEMRMTGVIPIQEWDVTIVGVCVFFKIWIC